MNRLEVIEILLAVNIENSNISIGIYKDNILKINSKICTDKKKTSDEYAITLLNVLKMYNINLNNISGAIIASVVPSLNNTIISAIKKLTNIFPIVVGPGVKNGLNIMIDNPSQLGADIVALSVAAASLYDKPVAVFDLGTATSISVIDKGNIFRGASIFPGAAISLEALISNTTQLNEISIKEPKDIIGTNTRESLESGIVYGTASMLDGMAQRLEKRIGIPLTMVATGDLAPLFLPFCNTKMIHNPELLMHGLYLIYRRNTQTKL